MSIEEQHLRGYQPASYERRRSPYARAHKDDRSSWRNGRLSRRGASLRRLSGCERVASATALVGCPLRFASIRFAISPLSARTGAHRSIDRRTRTGLAPVRDPRPATRDPSTRGWRYTCTASARQERRRRLVAPLPIVEIGNRKSKIGNPRIWSSLLPAYTPHDARRRERHQRVHGKDLLSLPSSPASRTQNEPSESGANGSQPPAPDA